MRIEEVYATFFYIQWECQFQNPKEISLFTKLGQQNRGGARDKAPPLFTAIVHTIANLTIDYLRVTPHLTKASITYETKLDYVNM